MSEHIRDGHHVSSYRRRNPGGGGKGGVAVVAVGLAVVMGVGPTTTLPRGIQPSPPSQAIRADGQAKAAKMAKNLVRVELRWRNRGYQATLRAEPAFDCTAHSYGRVQDFFARQDCDLLLRSYGAFRDRRGITVLVAFSWVEMPTTGQARALKTLVDTGGTGNVTELSRERWRYRNVKFLGLGYASGIEGRAVWNVQVQPAGRVPNYLLNEMRADVLGSVLDGTDLS